jgi:hypothetical protein
LVQAVQQHPKLFTVGTVTAVDEGTMSCKITPEDGGEVVDNVPIRVMRHGNQIGFSVVPKVNTEVIVMWLDEYRPTIFQIHEWDKVIVKNKGDVGMVIEGDEIWVGTDDFGLKIKPKTGPITVGKPECGLTVATPAGPITVGSSVCGLNVATPAGPVELKTALGMISVPGPGGTMTLGATGDSAPGISADKTVLKLGIIEDATHSVAWADAIASHLALLKDAYDAHNHWGMVPAPGPSPTPPNISSAEVKVS